MAGEYLRDFMEGSEIFIDVMMIRDRYFMGKAKWT
jgi:hypothetical protein